VKGALLVGSSPLAMIVRVMNEVQGTRILDVGCGCGVYGYLLRNKWQDTPPGQVQFRTFATRDCANDEPKLLAGLDIQLENIRRCSKHRIYDFLALAHANELPFSDNCFDTVLCIEVLEHLEKEKALEALRQMERVANKRIVVTVPRFALDRKTGRDERQFLKLDSQDQEVRDWVDAETHKCSFTAAELSRLGFRIGRSVYGGWRVPFRFFLKLWENRSGQILAIKELNKHNEAAEFAFASPNRYTEGVPDYR
jgi:ubiquinone/menaquinone biosynthesis C-methylase UbiE